jgi:hypothetical protein
VRTCGQAGTVATAERELPTLVVGNVVTLANEEGVWLVEHLGVSEGRQWAGVIQHQPNGLPTMSRVPSLDEVEMVFADSQAAVDYRILTATEATKARVRETLHGDPNYCRGCAKGWAGAKWHRDGCPVIEAREASVASDDNTVEVPGLPGVRVPAPQGDVWAPVNALRSQVEPHLHRETRQGGSPRVEGRFAVVIEGTTKFLRIKKITSGRWAGRVFVDSQASDSYYPVKAPATLVAYLSAVLANPQAAAKLYADELGECSDCGRQLTNDESRARGIGPECWSKH